MNSSNKQLDFLAIGDITTDAFIRLSDAEVTGSPEQDNWKLAVRFGDKVPYEFVEVVKAVGNSANAAVAAARLGLSSALVANVGGDDNGKDCIVALKENNVATDFIQVQADKLTNYHYVLWYQADRTILVKHQAFKYSFPQTMRPPRWMYLSSIGDHTEEYHFEIAQYLENNPDVKLAFQPGTFQMSMGIEKLSGIYKRTEVFIVNHEEAERILKMESNDYVALMKALHALGPYIVVITDGPRGAYAYCEGQAWFMPPYPDPMPPYERTGAGDAFASTFVAALAQGLSIEQALMWAPINSMAVVQEIGAQKGLLSHDELLAWLRKAPVEYKVKKIL